MNCEKCNAEMVAFVDGVSCGIKCPNCGYNIVTSCLRIKDIPAETCTIMIGASEKPEIAALRTIADICHCNYVEAQKKLKSGFELKNLTVYKAQLILQKLDKAGIIYTAVPVFSDL